jgi:hypothetical protein
MFGCQPAVPVRRQEVRKSRKLLYDASGRVRREVKLLEVAEVFSAF